MMKSMGPKLDQDMLQQFSRMVLECVFAEVAKAERMAGGGSAA
jgi:hypothetical protein